MFCKSAWITARSTFLILTGNWYFFARLTTSWVFWIACNKIPHHLNISTHNFATLQNMNKWESVSIRLSHNGHRTECKPIPLSSRFFSSKKPIHRHTPNKDVDYDREMNSTYKLAQRRKNFGVSTVKQAGIWILVDLTVKPQIGSNLNNHYS